MEDKEEETCLNKMTTAILQNNYMDETLDQPPNLSPVMSGDDIKVLHFARSRD